MIFKVVFFFFSSRRRHTRFKCDWSSDVCSSDLKLYISVSGLPAFDKAGRFIGYRGVARHITERKRAEEALRHMQIELAHANRVATMGQLSASIAQEVKQPITAAVTYAFAARRWLSAEPPNFRQVDDALSHIIKEGNRAGEVVTRIR